jgi:hypothetical protein
LIKLVCLVNTTDSLSPPSIPYWQLLGELELRAGEFVDGMPGRWLNEILKPLDLNVDFQNHILNATQQIIARVLRPDAETKLEHVHTLVFAPSKRTPKNHTWGFFSIEKLEDIKDGAVTSDHTIEIYLYVEGSAIPMGGNG